MRYWRLQRLDVSFKRICWVASLRREEFGDSTSRLAHCLIPTILEITLVKILKGILANR